MQRAIEEIGIPTIIIAALPPVVRQNGTPRATAPIVPMGANAGEPHNIEMQTGIVKDTLQALEYILRVNRQEGEWGENVAQI